VKGPLHWRLSELLEGAGLLLDLLCKEKQVGVRPSGDSLWRQKIERRGGVAY
jgi:hypothetical protein